MDASSLSRYDFLHGRIEKVPFVSQKKEKKEKKFTIICAIYWRDTTLRWSAGSWISYIPIAQLVNDRVGRWSVYVFVSIRHLNSGHYVCGHRCVPNANLYRFLFGIPFSQHGEFWWFHSFYVFFFYRRRLRNIQNFKKRTCWAHRPLNLFFFNQVIVAVAVVD